MLLYQMLLATSPFRGDDEDEIFDAILSDEPLYPIHMPRESVSILQKVLPTNQHGLTSSYLLENQNEDSDQVKPMPKKSWHILTFVRSILMIFIINVFLRHLFLNFNLLPIQVTLIKNLPAKFPFLHPYIQVRPKILFDVYLTFSAHAGYARTIPRVQFRGGPGFYLIFHNLGDGSAYTTFIKFIMGEDVSF